MSSLYAFFQIHSGHSPHSLTSYFIEVTMSWAAEVASLSRLKTKGNRIWGFGYSEMLTLIDVLEDCTAFIFRGLEWRIRHDGLSKPP
jgi:hypothetical protein